MKTNYLKIFFLGLAGLSCIGASIYLAKTNATGWFAFTLVGFILLAIASDQK